MQRYPYIPAVLIAALAMIFSAWIVGHYLLAMKTSGRSVTVRGLAERDIAADLAVWKMQFKTTGNDLSAAQNELNNQQKTAVTFLKEAGFTAEEIQILPTRLIDKQAREYGNNDYGQRYILEAGVSVRTSKVQLVDETSRKTSELVNKGVALSGENICDNIPSFMFTGLSEIKPEMLAEAMKDARAAADQFAEDASAEVGSIKNATQGYFSISARDNFDGQYMRDNCGDVASLQKRVRVVTTIDYYLE